jgi:neutral ceramidase
VVIGLLGVLGSAAPAQATPTTGTLQAGADARPFCTLDGVPLAGFGGGGRRKTFPSAQGYTFFLKPSEGVHDAARVKSLVVEVAGTPPVRFAFVSIDDVGASINIGAEVANRVSGLGLTRERIMFLGTHTHSGPGAVSDRLFWQIAAVDRFNAAVFEHVIGNIVDSLTAAAGALAPARLGLGDGHATGITNNRRHPGAAVDDRVAVIRVESAAGVPIAALFNFAVHGTCLNDDNLLMSADNQGYAERWLEGALPGAVALFANAAEGDVSPAGAGFDGAQAVGEALGAEVKVVWDAIVPTETTTIEVTSSLVTLPPLVLNLGACDPLLALLMNTFLVPTGAAETEELFMAVRLNESALVTVPGEAITEIGFAIQSQVGVAGFDRVLVMGLANGYMGYILTPAEYALGEYEACGTLHGPDTGTFVTEQAVGVGLALTPLVPLPTDGGVLDGAPADDASVVVDAGAGSDAAPLAADAGAPAADAGGPPADAAGPGDSGCGCRAAAPQAPGALALVLLVGLARRARRR